MTLISKQTWQDYFETSHPSIAAVVYSQVVVAILCLVSVLPTIVTEVGLTGIKQFLASGFGHWLNQILQAIDKFQMTNTVVTFLFWGAVGMVVYGFVTALLRGIQTANLERELIGGEYVHPANFTKVRFWREEFLRSAIAIITFILFVILLVTVVAGVLPTVIVYLRALIVHPSSSQIVPLATSTLLLLLGNYLTLFSWRLWRCHKILLEEL